jgi:energy-converting hydrogenase B subunit D
MIPLQLVILLLVAVAGLAVVLQRDPLRQTVVNGLYGLLLVVLFMVFQAPDVALSMLAVGSIAYPLVLLIAIARVRGRTEDTTDDDDR